MRQLIFILLIGFVSLFSCSKEEPNGYYWGTVIAQFNGDSWNAQPRAYVNKPYEQGIDFSMRRYDSQGNAKESLHFYKIPKHIGRHKLSETDVRDIDTLSGVRLYTLIGGDALGDVYHPLEGVGDNYLEITKLEGGQIWAEFQVAFVRKIVGTITNYPDTVVLTNGKIHTLIMRPE